VRMRRARATPDLERIVSMLIGQRVCLGPMLNSDAGIIFNWHNTTEVMHLDGLYRPVSQGNFDEWFGSIGRDPSRVVFSIRKQGDLSLIGYVQITNIHPVFRSAEMGIMIGDPENRGKGYGQEALRLCIEFGWRELNLNRLALMIVGDNGVAQAAYRKAGFQVEGVLKRAVFINGKFRDTTVMGLLAPESVS